MIVLLLIAAVAPHSGDFLAAVLFSPVENRLHDSLFKYCNFAIALRLGAPVCDPRECLAYATSDFLTNSEVHTDL